MSSIIVAGGSGFIGQEVIRAALDGRDATMPSLSKVVNIDLSPPRPVDPRLSGYYDINADPRVRFIQADVSDEAQVAQALAAALAWAGDVTAVCNLVGLVRYGVPDARLYPPNVKAVENLVGECAARGLLFLQLSGTAVHGSSLRGKVKETDPVRPVEAYGRSKALAERAIFDGVANQGLRAVIFRATNPVGPELQLSELNKLWETVMNDPLVPAVRGTRATYVSTIDTGRAFIFAATHADLVVPPAPEQLSDLVYNLGVRESFSDRQAATHLIRSTRVKGSKPIVELPASVAISGAWVVTTWTRALNLVRRHKKAPVLHYELAKLFRGSHDHDQTKFIRVFEGNGFTFVHPTSEAVLDVGTVYKFATDWSDREPPPRVAELVRQFLAERSVPATRP